jgi:hypothetical protein
MAPDAHYVLLLLLSVSPQIHADAHHKELPV